MQGFVEGVLLGLGVSVPIGPINVLIMTYALQSYTRALCLGLGAMSADILYLVISGFGVLQFLNAPLTFKVLAVFGGVFLIYMAYAIFKSAQKTAQKTDDIRGIFPMNSHIKVFIKGFLINILNPYVIIFWISVATLTAGINGKFNVILSGLVFGIMLWITLFPLMIYKNRSMISKRAAKNLAYASAVILVFFASMLIYKIFLKGGI